MNGKERVRAAIARQPVDRVPLGFYVADCDTIERVIGHKTLVRDKVETQIALWEGRRDELAQCLKEDSVEFYRRLDCVDLIVPKEAQLLPPRDYEPERPRRVAEDVWEDRAGRVYRAVRDANDIQCVYDPNLESRIFSVEEFSEPPLDFTPPDRSVFEVFDHLYAALGEERYIASPTAGMTAMPLLGGMQRGLMLYASQPDVILAANQRSTTIQNAMDRYYVHPGAPGALLEEDTGSTRGPLISPRTFRRLCYPFLKSRVESVKRYAPQVIFHNCGCNIPLMDMFIDCSIDCYQSLQTDAGMEVGLLKQRFGDRLAFWGGVPVELLIGGTTDDVRQSVRTAMERGAPGGGFILGPSQSIAMNTRYDNFMAMLDEFVCLRDRF